MSDIEPIPLELGGTDKVQYFKYVCSKCGMLSQNTYSEPYRTRMLEQRLCFTCNHWQEFAEQHNQNKAKLTLIEHHIYTPGNRTYGEFRGMAGRRFDIEYISPSPYTGKRITTFDLWSGGTLPEDLWEQFPDTAKFLNNAERVNLGEGKLIEGCWNPSISQTEPYPLPRTLGID